MGDGHDDDSASRSTLQIYTRNPRRHTSTAKHSQTPPPKGADKAAGTRQGTNFLVLSLCTGYYYHSAPTGTDTAAEWVEARGTASSTQPKAKQEPSQMGIKSWEEGQKKKHEKNHTKKNPTGFGNRSGDRRAHYFWGEVLPCCCWRGFCKECCDLKEVFINDIFKFWLQCSQVWKNLWTFCKFQPLFRAMQIIWCFSPDPNLTPSKQNFPKNQKTGFVILVMSVTLHRTSFFLFFFFNDISNFVVKL